MTIVRTSPNVSVKEVQARGKKRYRVRVRVKKKGSEKGSNVTKTFSCVEQAFAWGKLKTQELRGVSSRRKEKIQYTNRKLNISESTSLKEAIEQYLDELTESGLNRSYASSLRVISEFDLAFCKLKSISYGVLKEFCRERKAEGRSQATINGDISALLKFFELIEPRLEFSLDRESLKSKCDLLWKEGYRGHSSTRTRRLEEAEYEKIRSYLLERSRRTDKAYHYQFDILLATGLRLEVPFKIQWKDINWSDNLITVNNDKRGKSEAPIRQMPMPDNLKRVLIDHLLNHTQSSPESIEKNGPEEIIKSNNLLHQTLFNNEAKTFSSVFREACKLYDIQGLCTHDLKREAVSRLMEAGIAPSIIRFMTGNKSSRIIEDVYANMSAFEVTKTINAAQAAQS